jgi:hypothetical protein
VRKDLRRYYSNVILFQARIGLISNSPLENRKFAAQLVELILYWEKRRRQELRIHEEEQRTLFIKQEIGSVTPMEGISDSSSISQPTTTTTTATGTSESEKLSRRSESQSSLSNTALEFTPSSQTVEIIVSFLVLLARNSVDVTNKEVYLTVRNF